MTTEKKRLTMSDLAALLEAEEKPTSSNVEKTTKKPEKKVVNPPTSEPKRLTMHDMVVLVESGRNLDGTRATKSGVTTKSKPRSLKKILSEEPIKVAQNHSDTNNEMAKLVEAVERSYQTTKTVDTGNNESIEEAQTNKPDSLIEEKDKNINKSTSDTKQIAVQPTKRRTDKDIDVIEECLGAIYKITCNITKKCYIGQAKLVKYKGGKAFRYGPIGRWADHMSDVRQESTEHTIHKAIREHGVENFTLTVLEVTHILDLTKKEGYYINKYQSIEPDGYNMILEISAANEEDRVNIIGPQVYQNIVNSLTQEILDGYHKTITDMINDPDYKRLRSLDGKIIKRVRIAPTVRSSAPRSTKGNKIYKGPIIVVYAMTDLARNALIFRFGGLNESLDESYANALRFARKIKLIPDGKFDDEVPAKIDKYRKDEKYKQDQLDEDEED